MNVENVFDESKMFFDAKKKVDRLHKKGVHHNKRK